MAITLDLGDITVHVRVNGELVQVRTCEHADAIAVWYLDLSARGTRRRQVRTRKRYNAARRKALHAGVNWCSWDQLPDRDGAYLRWRRR